MTLHGPEMQAKAAEALVVIDREILLGQITRDDGLTEEEGAVHDALMAAINGFSRLKRQHPDEMRDFVDGIHKCQDQLAVRIVRRHYPKGWPDKGGES